MPIVLFIEKNGTIKEMKLKEVVPNELYRKASFKTAEGFDDQTKWSKPGKYNIHLYARKTGRSGSENKYDFPPPVDSELFFGGCILTNKDTNGKYCDLTIKTWNKIYEELFGGFDDIDSEDSSSDEEEDEDKNIPRTKEGYAKDGFIVDDVEAEGEDSQDESEDELSDESDIEIENDVDVDDVDTDDLCEESDSDVDAEDSVESETEDIDEDEDEDECYDSDGSGGVVSQKKKKKTTKKPVVVQKNKNKSKTNTKSNSAVKQRPSTTVNTRSKSKKTIVENTEVNNGYLNCSDELEEEAYLE